MLLKCRYNTKRNIEKCYYFDEDQKYECRDLFLITFWIFEINIKTNSIEECPYMFILKFMANNKWIIMQKTMLKIKTMIWQLPAAAKSLQSCLTLCDPVDGSPPGSPVPGILQARTLAWVAMSFSNAWKWKVKVKSLSRVWLLATPWTAAHQAPPSMGFSRQEYWSGVPLPSPTVA